VSTRHLHPTSVRRGFTVIELLIVLVISGILISISANGIGAAIRRDRVVRSASVVEGLLTEAGQLAVRRRKPVTVTLSGTTFSINDRATSTAIKTKNFGPGFDLRATLAFNPSGGITVFPNGRADQALTVTVSGHGISHTVSRTATGIVRRQ
jgi:prepilin-type N-terminal cleavage/methylation domain-containing protein